MSKLLKIKHIEQEFIINPGAIYNINIENSKLYYSLINDLVNGNIDTFIYSEDSKLLDFTKHSLRINDIFNIDPNSKKILSSLYKRINDKLIDNNDKDTILEINDMALKLLTKIALDLNLPVDFETDLDVVKILNMYKFCFKDEFETPLEKIVGYIKANIETTKFDFIISINILPLFNEEELFLLSQELKYNQLSLININLIQKKSSSLVKSITIDNDLCEF